MRAALRAKLKPSCTHVMGRILLLHAAEGRGRRRRGWDWHPARAAARPRRRGAGHAAGDWPRPAAWQTGRQALGAVGDGVDCQPADRARLQARHRARAGRGHRRLEPGPAIAPGSGRRGRALSTGSARARARSRPRSRAVTSKTGRWCSSVEDKALAAERVVGAYKDLAHVERAFRSLKTVDLHLRPIHHWLAPRVRAHVFLCMLACHVNGTCASASNPCSSMTTILLPPPASAPRSRRLQLCVGCHPDPDPGPSLQPARR